MHALLQSTVLAHIEEQFFDVSGHTFALQAYRHRDGRSRHELNLCANGREVTTTKLRDLLPELPEKFLDDEQALYTLIVLVTGEYLARLEKEHPELMTPKAAATELPAGLLRAIQEELRRGQGEVSAVLEARLTAAKEEIDDLTRENAGLQSEATTGGGGTRGARPPIAIGSTNPAPQPMIDGLQSS